MSLLRPRFSHGTSAPGTTGRIDVNGLRVWFGTVEVIHGVDLEFPPRQVLAIIGPSGCGKSTLLRTLNRLHEETPGARLTGSITLDGEDIHAPGVDLVELRKRVGNSDDSVLSVVTPRSQSIIGIER